MEEKIINYKKLDIVVKDTIGLFNKHNLDLDEQRLILNIMEDRRINEINKLKTSDALSNIPFASLFKKASKELKEEE